MYTIGGVDVFGKYLENTLRYDLETHTWLEPLTWGKDVSYPQNNFHATVQKSDGTALVFGGKSNGYSSNLWSFDLENLSWSLLQTTGDVPAGRYGHTMVINEKNTKVYLFGGYDNDLGLNNDLYELDITTMRWTYLKCAVGQDMPEPRYGHYSVLIKDRKGNLQILVYGGRRSNGVLDDLWIYDIKSGKWFELNVTGEKPPGRYGFGAFVADRELFILGGFDGKTVVFDDLWAINFKSSKRTWRNAGKQGFIERYYQTINLTPQGIVIFGGRRADHTLCLYIQQGINRGKKFELRNDIKKLTLVPELANEGILSSWLKEICDLRQPREVPEKLKPFVKKYNEKFQSLYWFQQNLIKYAVDVGFFHDMEVKLLDSIETAHSFYLLLNVDLIPNTTKNDIETSLQTSKPLPLPFTKDEWTLLKQYFYTRTIHITDNNNIQLLVLAAKHKMDMLLQLSCKYLFYQSDILHTMQIGLEHNIEPVMAYAVWCMKCNYTLVRDDPRFLGLPEKVKEEVKDNFWPGLEYQKELAAWRAEQEKNNSKNCLVQ
uniref:BTB domain-containing protein n=1 Tax=Arcella intermedia TaxID=1963864 RepID=A0A6B2L104_9EUKA